MGINLNKNNRFQLGKIKHEIIKIEKLISKNMEQSNNIPYLFTKKELDGLSENVLHIIAKPKDKNSYYICLNKNSYMLCMNCIKK